MIGLGMFYVVGRVFLDNAAGALGEADIEMRQKIGSMVMSDPDVRDIQKLAVLKEGEDFHVELKWSLIPIFRLPKRMTLKIDCLMKYSRNGE